jgi:hypothetical protein
MTSAEARLYRVRGLAGQANAHLGWLLIQDSADTSEDLAKLAA